MSMNPKDDQLLHQALELARAGAGLASPNPLVGALIVDVQGELVGTGTYSYAGVKHAEILALESAGERARGGTLYVNLEPHGHQGRTPPCTNALIAAGVRRVVASMADPNPRVSGRGFKQLENAGVLVDVGRFEQEARRLNEAFARYIRHGVPLVTLKSAMSLDAKIEPGFSGKKNAASNAFSGTWITGEAARRHAHEMRHENDAILVGIGTILADNPLLTDRSGLPRRRPLLRVILDSQLRLPTESRIVQSAAAERKDDVLVFCISADENRQHQLKQLGVWVEQVPADANGRPEIREALRRLADREITSVMVEGGASINAAILRQQIADKIFFYYAPAILGSGSVPFAVNRGENVPGDDLRRGLRVTDVRLHSFGEDLAVEGYLRDPYD
ncbi:MAG TPA: bifunctional diaminohydroxyphosphoribosylaminopyrimidine deaminase/5-amino-6-(5-phosphoribosylamino)uracil reductase RibD [Verrucomicrobiae bacterium]|jgi:diaminohydroxyphosphoribosylaminopyrimidine deaminase / 5-amino-6-(5-phosphoribosylamino)uracil reductase|nr:bifunctional diaminohydroxyphosphoribosylaminopyrimidine deaminase/5-amino-6-(5-phosphoribosylamino)uracil reductase RibD [Verrucomicrobiae bacterium]